MKIHYDNSKNGLIIALSAFIVGFIVYFIINGYPVYYALLIDLAFAIPLIICVCARRKFYIKIEGIKAVFTIKYIEKHIEKSKMYSIELSNIKEITLNRAKSLLTISTNIEKYELHDFHASILKLQELFKGIEIIQNNSSQ